MDSTYNSDVASPKIDYDFDDNESSKKDRPHWNSKNTLKLIKALEIDCKALWDSTDTMYKVRSERQERYEYLASMFDTNAEEINRKIHNLRTQFNCELRKLRRKQSGASEGAHEASRWEYFDSLSFLQRTPQGDTIDVNLELSDFQADEDIGLTPAVSISKSKPRKPALRVSATPNTPIQKQTRSSTMLSSRSTTREEPLSTPVPGSQGRDESQQDEKNTTD
ncbi:unnamed protein product [Leptidea sinapis]|uniref:MADF domain-containing protein n=1 Tax=Leptidea sinapis TaxID=189913 RepID=A0A5E4QS14_9NEOP|nr:unnamed protein product [Leptidea sinapis]